VTRDIWKIKGKASLYTSHFKLRQLFLSFKEMENEENYSAELKFISSKIYQSKFAGILKTIL
jgi:hypothetical protein